MQCVHPTKLTMRAKMKTNSMSSSERYTTWLKLRRMVVMMRLSSDQLRASLNTRRSRAVLSTDKELEPARRAECDNHQQQQQQQQNKRALQQQ